MFFVISKLFEFFASPSHFALFALAAGVALSYTRHVTAGRRLTTAGAVLLLAIAFGPIGYFLAAPLESRFPEAPADMPAPDGIVVLGGAVDEAQSGEKGRIALNEAAERLTTPIELLRRYPHARLVFTGGSAALTGSRFTEAQAVRLFWRSTGVDLGDVVYEDRSRNTFENAVFTRDLVRPKAGERWLLVTSAMHMPRSMGIFRKAGFPVIPYPVDYRTNGDNSRPYFSFVTQNAVGMTDSAAHEWVGLVAYYLTGKTDALFPAP
jgi:uncharacterized SAM-binding protein YcdF (DUF218 family)